MLSKVILKYRGLRKLNRAAFDKDNREDCAFLLSDTGRKAIIGLHVDGIVAYLNDAEPEPFREMFLLKAHSIASIPSGNEAFSLSLRHRIYSRMNEDLANIQYSPIWDYKYARFFEEGQYNGKTLSEAERREFVAMIDETIAQYSEGLPMMYNILESIKDQHDDDHEIDRTVVSVMQFVLITMIDSMVASKYFILADGDYDRRFMRGKLMVILNEGFKRLYGFDEKTHKKSEWDRLLPLMGRFPEIINRQYQELTYHLEKHAKSSSWWKEERNLETHMDTEKLYVSRQEEIIESKVMMDSMKLFNTLLAVNHFLTNVHACLFNFLVGKYKRGELKDE